MKVKRKRGAETPPRIRSFINNVVSTPLESIHTVLSSFYWDFEKGDFFHWLDLINHFDSFLEKFVTSRKDLQLDLEGSDESDVPKEAVLQVLRVTRCLLDNCVNRSFYNSLEHLTVLLASTDPDIVLDTLLTLASYVKRPAQVARAFRVHRDPVMNGKLFSLSQGWGGKEEGLGLLACTSSSGCDAEACRLGSFLHFEFYKEGESRDSSASGLQVIHIENLHQYPGSDLQVLKTLVEQYKVPDNLKFSLLTRIRFARAFSILETRRQYVRIRLAAFTALIQSNPDHEDLAAFFVNEPEFVNELVSLLYHEDEVPEDVRMLALGALAGMSMDRPRQAAVYSVLTAGGNCGIIPTLVQKAVASLASTTPHYSLNFVEALLQLVSVLVSSSSGCAALREAGLIPILLPLLKDTNRRHIHLVILAVHILEAFMDYSNPASTLFRDLGGLDDTIFRLKVEVSAFEDVSGARQEEASSSKGKAPISEDAGPTHDIPYHHRVLLKALLRAISLGTYAPGGNARLHGSEESSLPFCLSTIFKHAKLFGGGVFSLAASVMSDLIHRDPTCFPSLDKAGLPGAFLDAITSGVLPSSEAICCIPTSLDAICLNNAGLEAVKDRDALRCFVKIFTSKMYLKALANDTPGSLASSLDELMRHVPALRALGIDVCIEILRTIAAMGGAVDVDTPVPMDTDGGEEKQPSEDPAPETSSSTAESSLSEYINNSVRLLETVLQNADTSKLFIEKGGIEALLQLYTLPDLPVSFGGSSTAHNMSVTFRAFPPQHAATLTKSVCKVLREDLKVTLALLESIAGSRIFELETGLKMKVLRSLSATECFLSLSAVLVRSSPVMLAELSTGEADILHDIGRVHREVLWQVCLASEGKTESKKEVDEASASAASSSSARENEEDLESLFSVGGTDRQTAVRSGPADWGIGADFFAPVRTDSLHRRSSSRREPVSTAEALSQIARMGRLARQGITSTNIEVDTVVEQPPVQESSKRKSPEVLNYEMVMKLVLAARSLYLALGKSMVIPSRRRDDLATMSVPAKSVASGIAKVFLENLSFEPAGGSPTVRCRYLGKVAEDIQAVLFDSRRKTCNTVLVNRLYVYGTFAHLLETFEEVSELLWTVGFGNMQAENGKEAEASDQKSESHSWLWNTLHSYLKLIEQLVTSTTLLSPISVTHLLVQPVQDAPIAAPKDVEQFVQSMQMQALNAILPVWNHPSFAECNTTFITSIAGIIRQIYAGAGDTKSRSSSGGANPRLGPAPDEALISTIMEMGFPRARAEAALRNSEASSVELAMEWLFTHPEEVTQEEDELARALALSLGNADGEGEAGKATEMTAEEEEIVLQMPDVEKMVNTCINILQMKDAVIFTLTDLLVTISNYSSGRDRPLVVSFLVEQLKRCHAEGADWNRLSTVSHLMALVLTEDTPAREVAAKSGLVGTSLEILASYNDTSSETPVWVTALCLVLDQMLQVKVNTDSTPASNASSSSSGGEAQDQTPFASILGRPAGYMTDEEREKSMAVVCRLLHMPLMPMPLQAVLQLCARLTKVHAMALQFLDGGGLTALLDIPPANWSGFDEVAGAIIRHLMEDPQTLLLAMESEIRHCFTVAARQNGRVSPRLFLSTLAPVLTRDPAMFMQAAANVCQLDSSNGGRLTITLVKEEREKEKDKEKATEKGKEKERQGSRGEVAARIQDRGGKSHKRVPHSFSRVIDQLLEVILHYPSGKGGDGTSMEIDKKLEKTSCETEALLEAAGRAAAGKVSFILKLMTEILLMYSSSVSVVLRRDSESSQGRGPSQAGAEAVGHGGLLYHIVHRILPEGIHQTPADVVEVGKLSERAAAFLRAVCVRSGEGRRRVLNEIVKALNMATQAPSGSQSSQPTIKRIHAFVNLIISILLSPSTGNPQTLGFSTDMSKAMVDAGMVRSLTNSLQAVDLDHPDANKVVNVVLRALEVLSRTGSSLEQPAGVEGGNQKEGDAQQSASENPLQLQHDGEIAQHADQQEQLNSSSMAEDTRQERDNPRAEAEVFMQEVGEVLNDAGRGMVFRVNSGADVGDEEEEEEDEMEVDDGEEEEEDEEEEEEEDEDAEGNDGVPHMSPPDTDVEDQDNSLSDDFEDMGDLDDGAWQGDRVIEVRWTDGLTGLNHVHVLGQSNRNTVDLHVETFQNMSMDDIFGSFRQSRGADRSRVGTYRSGASNGVPRGGASRHPLLVRPSQGTGPGVSTASLWSGNTIRDVEALLAGNSEGTRIFMTDQVTDALFGERGALQPAQILDASMDPMLLMGRRGGRSESRLSSWTDDGQTQSGTQSTAVAQAVESAFVARLQALATSDDQPEAARQAGTEAPSAEPAANAVAADAPAQETQATGEAERREPSGIACQTDLDMAVQDVPAGQNSERSQDSGGSGATLGESLRSLEVEIGSADGREENDRQVHSERLGAEEMIPARGLESASREAHMEVDEDLDNVVSQQAQATVQEDSVQAQATDQQDAGEEITGRNDASSIDPRFLEALPEDLRAEVLASQQNQSSRNNVENHPTPPTEEIDPEFLAALPPELQAEVLEQQQAQRIFQSQQVEGRPVDMDSASIIATFPAELREEVLLTSSDAVLAALSPALLAEAQLLRERAMANIPTRNPFGGPRLTARRTNGIDRGVSAGMFSVGRRLPSARSSGSASGPKEPEGKALVDEQAVKTLVRLLRLAQPLIKGLLQRLLSNLCVHSGTRSALLRLLLDMLRPESEGYCAAISADGAPSQRLYGCQWNVVYARAQLSDGIPPLVSRRVLEVLTHLARSHTSVAKSLLYLEQEPSERGNEAADKGKEKMYENPSSSTASDIQPKYIPIVLFLKLLDRPLYSRSSQHLEQVLGLLEVVTSCTGMDSDAIDNSNGLPSDTQPSDAPQETSSESPQQQPENPPTPSITLSKTEADILSKLPKNELCNMCRLLAQDGLSSVSYSRVSEVLKKLSDAVPLHRRLFISELADAAHKLSVPAVNELRSLADNISGGSSSAGTAILRVLQALSALTNRDAKADELQDIIRELNVVTEPLWQQLSISIGRIESRLTTSSSSSIVGALGAVTSPLPQGSQKVLDFVEAFLVLCEKLRPQTEGTGIDLESPSSTSDWAHTGSSSFKLTNRPDERGLNFIRFAERHRRLLNAFLRQNSGLLEKSFSLLLKTPRLIDFDNKRAYFRSRIRQQHEQQHFGPLRISVRRAYVLEDSYNQLRMRTPDEVKGRLTVQFQGEEGIDAGGLTREWYQLLSRVIFDKGALLFTTVGNESTFQPNPNSVYQTEHLSYFKFVGRVVSKALFDGQLLDVYFTRSFYKHILGTKVTYHDIEAVDPDYYKNLKWLLENDVNDILGLTFSIDADEEKHILYEKTEVTDHELVPGGRNIRVTEENKHEYVDLIAEHRLTTAIRPQINAFLEGFNELVPRELISIFNDKELELLISGLPEIDLDDLRANTEYTGYSSGSPVVQWFWEVVQDFSKEDMARLLQFITGTSKVPLEGFKALQGISGPQKFQIHKAYGAPERLPSAHTCFNQLDLPEYSSKDQMHDRLLLAIHEASEGFGFG
ncbi:ubiquitin-protein ligase, UPL1 [Selaginella moellendorffii]|uniref:HECT-type E3 ubiquitin transferase n=1 Tax=Selaginella moellendorffii TaxID=88036 RepID=D8SC62_SELML|nr:E3 ubiquitin-protein ligase UPL1 [Selaginella moellendorffii]EFJ18137.1 ubiquitin-protein ligase, UPL1 [Selaginella moellendorffii]|eukprot:XP_002980952.1 E3 ubiquitin-protein ligase UPL1 [Selaginella moellendorffii]